MIWRTFRGLDSDDVAATNRKAAVAVTMSADYLGGRRICPVAYSCHSCHSDPKQGKPNTKDEGYCRTGARTGLRNLDISVTIPQARCADTGPQPSTNTKHRYVAIRNLDDWATCALLTGVPKRRLPCAAAGYSCCWGEYSSDGPLPELLSEWKL